MIRPLRIAHVAPPLEPVPPPAYGGTEQIVAELVRELVARGHDVTTFASGDSTVPGRLVPTVPVAIWRLGPSDDTAPWFTSTIDLVAARAMDFDLIHSHLEWYSPILARSTTVPVVTTWHGRLDLPGARSLLRRSPSRHVAISRAQASTHPDVPWAAIIHNGLSLSGAPFEETRGEDLVFVGRVAPEKGVVDAIEIARRTGRRLWIAAKSGKTRPERDYYDDVFRPALDRAGPLVEWLGEVPRLDRDRLLARAFATLMPGAWPEPFGLVAIESLACGTPVVARRVGALPEIVRHGQDGFLGGTLEELVRAVEWTAGLDRSEIRASVRDRFSAVRMTDAYEALYERVLTEAPAADRGRIVVIRPDVAAAAPAAPLPPVEADPDPAEGRPDAASGARATG